MALTVDFANRIIDASASITDIVAFHQALREFEASELGILYPIVHTFKALDIGGGGFFYSVEFINTWRLRFQTPGNYTITGNIGATIIGVAGVYVERTKALAFATTSAGGGGGGGLTNEDRQMLTDIAKIHGLVRGTPMIVTATARSAGDVVQTIAEVGGVVTLNRP